MRLGRWLRLVGMDVANPKEANDKTLLQKAKRENRVLITRDRRLAALCKTARVDCILINSNRLSDQMEEMACVGVKLQLNPRRCTICNGILRDAVRPTNGQFPVQEKIWECEDCKKLYWAGSHWKRIEETLEEIGSGED